MRHPGQIYADRIRLVIVVVYALTMLVVTVHGVNHSVRWIDTSFPGFFVMPNRVVPSVALEHWSGGRTERLFQAEIIAVDGEPVSNAAMIYERVAAHPAGDSIRYTLRRGDLVWEQKIGSTRFTASDYAWFFGPLFVNGVIFTAIGIAVWLLGHPSAATTATTLLALNVGLFTLSAVDLYRPGAFFRVHVVTEATFPFAVAWLTLVFPVARLGRLRKAVAACLALTALLLVAVYEGSLYQPTAYSRSHNLCMVLWGLAGTCFIGSNIFAYVTNRNLLVRSRLRILAIGVVLGFAIPAWLMIWSGLGGGAAKLNAAAFTAFLFPASLAYAVVKHDLFEIDAALRRTLAYMVLTALVASCYGLIILGSSTSAGGALFVQSPLFPIVFSVLVIFVFNPLRSRVQHFVDRVFHHTTRDLQQTLEQTSRALAATLDSEQIYDLAIDTSARALSVERASLWVRSHAIDLTAVRTLGLSTDLPRQLDTADPVTDRVRHLKGSITIYDFLSDDAVDPQTDIDRRALAMFAAEVLVPIGVGNLTGLLALGRKRSQRLYTLADLGFLNTLANQVAVALQNAESYRKLQDMNASLEQQVKARTAALSATIEELRNAYAEVQRSHESLIHAEKMAALGRLTAGIAHEVSTPLGATITSLRALKRLVAEYEGSIDNASVTSADHREIAADLRRLAQNLENWTGKAAGYIRGIKAHTQGITKRNESTFRLAALLEDVRALLEHRLRLSGCSVAIECPPEVALYGDAGKLAQVLTNLLANAIDASEDQAGANVIFVRARATPDATEIVVEDRGCGIEPENMPRLFDEFFTTKVLGKGTGLGLPIARHLVRSYFDGDINVTSTEGCGSLFTVVLPRKQSTDAQPTTLAASA